MNEERGEMIKEYGQVIVNYEYSGEIMVTGFTWVNEPEDNSTSLLPLQVEALEWGKDKITEALAEIEKVEDE